MIRGTKGRALLKLAPLQNSNIGAITEEWVRYWTNVKDEKEANDLKGQLALAKNQAALDKEMGRRDLQSYEKLKLLDSNGYFRGQVAEQFRKEQPELAELARRANRGDQWAGQRLAQKMQFYQELVNMDKATEEVHSVILKQKDDLNILYDTPQLEVLNRLRKGMFIIDGTKIKVPQYDTEDPNDFITFNSPGEFATHLRDLTSFVGNPKFNEKGSEIASEIVIPNNDGNMKMTGDIVKSGIAKARLYFRNNKIARNTWIYSNDLFTDAMAKEAGFEDARSAIEKGYLDRVDASHITEVASHTFYNKAIVPSIVKKSNGLRNAATLAYIAGRNMQNAEAMTTIAPMTTANSKELLTKLKPEDAKGNQLDSSRKGIVYNISGGGIHSKDPGGTGSERTYTHLMYVPSKDNPNGEVIAFFEQEVYATDKKGNKVGNPMKKTFYEPGDVAIGNLAGQLYDTSVQKRLSNQGELVELMKNQIGQIQAGSTQLQSSQQQSSQQPTSKPRGNSGGQQVIENF